MSFKPVRTFFQDRLNEIDPDFQEHDEAFNVDNIGGNNFNKRYHIFYGDVSTSSSNQNTTQDTVHAEVTLFFDGFRNKIEALDDSMDIANQFRLNCLRMSKLVNQGFIKLVVANSIKAVPLATNENAIKIKLGFSINVIFGTNINLDA